MKRAIIAAAGGLAVAALLSMFALSGPGRRLEWILYDVRLRLWRTLAPRAWHVESTPIRVITIDDATIEGIEQLYEGYDDPKQKAKGRWRWSREVHARLLQILSQPDCRPRAIAFDVVFRKRRPEDPYGDAALTHWVGAHDGAVLAYHFEIPDATGLPDVVPLSGVPAPLEQMAIPAPNAGDLLQPADPRTPWPELAQAGRLGFINAPRDDDGVVRRMPLVMQCGDQAVPALSLAAVASAYGCNPSDIEIVPGRWVRFTTGEGKVVRIPIDAQGRMLINYPGRWESMEQVPFLEVLRWQRWAATDPKARAALESFKDSIVFVGMNYTLEPDVMPTPLEDLCPGVGVHAAAAHGMVTGSRLRDCPLFVDVGFVVLASLGAAALATWPPVKWAGPAFALTLVAIFGVGWVALFHLERVVWAFTPLAAGVVSFAGLMAFRQMVTDRKRRRVRRLFSQYVSPVALGEIVDRADRLGLGGRRMQAVVLFSDLRGFTSLTERIGPEAIIEVLNEYFEAMTEVIQKHGGAVNKFVGDEIFATFGVPLAHDDDARRAVRAGIEMQQRLAAMRVEWKEQGKPELRMGVGISRGDVVAGTIGSKHHKDYTAIGDAVNLGARLQELTKEFDEQILVCQAIWDLVHDHVSGRPLEEVLIRGRSQPCPIYAIDVAV